VLFYTSPSHTPESPRWRVLAPTSSELPADRHGALAARVNGLFHGACAGESFTLSQAYFFGHVHGRPPLQIEVIDGDFIDQRDDLDATAVGRNQDSGRQKPRGFDELAAAEKIAKGVEYHESTVGLLGKWARDGVPLEDAVARLQGIYDRVPEAQRDARWRERLDDVERCAKGIYDKENERRGGRPQIHYDPTDPERMVAEAEDALLGSGVIFYQQDDRLVRIKRLTRPDEENGVRHNEGALILRPSSRRLLSAPRHRPSQARNNSKFLGH
jgi:hypothetical protein